MGVETFYREVRGVPLAVYTEMFDAVGKPFVDDLKYLFEQYVGHCPAFSPRNPGELNWVMFKASFHYFLQYFRNWMDEASQGVLHVSVPRGERLMELEKRKIPLLLFKIPFKQEEGATKVE